MERYNKIAVVVPFYKRHRLTSLCFKRLLSQSKKLKFDVVVAGSEGEDSKKIAKGLKYIEVENQPLGKKLNALLNECRKYDGVIIIGSDDFMSDSIIKMYQQMDISKEVYYSFNDIYIYSSRLGIIKSDFDYTRAGNGIGVARLYTKSTLEKMNYKIWEDNRPKGLDGNADKRLRAKGIKEIQLDLGNHFLIDVKIEQNISSHEMIHSGHKEHSLDVFDKLGNIGKDILKLEAEDKERIYNRVSDVEKLAVKVLKDFNNHKKGSVILLKKHNQIKLEKAGFVKLIS
jgi:hypothetical protein